MVASRRVAYLHGAGQDGAGQDDRVNVVHTVLAILAGRQSEYQWILQKSIFILLNVPEGLLQRSACKASCKIDCPPDTAAATCIKPGFPNIKLCTADCHQPR